MSGVIGEFLAGHAKQNLNDCARKLKNFSYETFQRKC